MYITYEIHQKHLFVTKSVKNQGMKLNRPIKFFAFYQFLHCVFGVWLQITDVDTNTPQITKSLFSDENWIYLPL